MGAPISQLPSRLRQRLKTGGLSLLGPMLVCLTVVGLQQLGALQSMELWVYDQGVRWRPSRGMDERLLLVTLTEQELHDHGGYPISDQILVQLLQELERYQPRAVGLDIYRDLQQQPGHQQLMDYLHHSDTIVITKVRDHDSAGIPPPPGVPGQRVGFNDVLVDSGGVVRRQLLFLTDPEADQTYYAFALRLAMQYLAPLAVLPQPSPQQPEYLQLGEAVFVPLEQTFGPYQTVDDRGYQILLHYRTPGPIAPEVTLTEVLAGGVDPALIQDKVVLIGSRAVSANDAFYTPYSLGDSESQQMAGVELQAQMVSQLLDVALGKSQLFWSWPNRLEWIWIGVWVGVGWLLVGQIRPPLQVLVAGLGSLGTLVGLSFWMFTQQGWIPVAAPSLGLLGAAMTHWVLTGRSLDQQRQIGQTLLRQNTSKPVAEWLWQQWEPLLREGRTQIHTVEVTVLFADLRQFSAISEHLPPQPLMNWLNDYFNAQAQLVSAHDGFISKFMGDGLMAVFGLSSLSPCPCDPDLAQVDQAATQAVICALEMGKYLEVLNRDWQARGLPTAEVRIGIATGTASVGTMGGRDRLEYGVIGDSVNVASRLESYEKHRQICPCRILVDQATLERVRVPLQVEPWGSLQLVGRKQPVMAYQVRGLEA